MRLSIVMIAGAALLGAANTANANVVINIYESAFSNAIGDGNFYTAVTPIALTDLMIGGTNASAPVHDFGPVLKGTYTWFGGDNETGASQGFVSVTRFGQTVDGVFGDLFNGAGHIGPDYDGSVPVGGVNAQGFAGSLVLAGGVPEASTWAMMLAGFAGLGFLGLRSSRKPAAIT